MGWMDKEGQTKTKLELLAHCTVYFWCQATHPKILQRFTTSMKIYAIKIFSNPTSPFRVTSLLARPNQPFWLNWLLQLAGTLKGHMGFEYDLNGIFFHRLFDVKICVKSQ